MSETVTRETVTLSLHDGQIDVWRAPQRFKVVVAGRRWGKTLFARVWLLSLAMHRGAGRYWYVAPTRDDAKDVMWGDLKMTCHPHWLAESPRESELSLQLINGAEIRLWSAEKGDTLRGRALKGLVMDEYAIQPKHLFHEVLGPSLADFEAPALWVGTPKSFNHFHELFLRGQSADPQWSDWASWQFRSVDNPTPAVQREAERQRQELDPRTYRQEWEASFEAVAGRAYYAFSRQFHVAPVTLNTGDPVSVFFDFNVQPCSGGIGQKQGDRPVVWRTVQLTDRGGEATKATAAAIKALLDQAGHHGPVHIHGDATGRSAKTTGPADHAVLRETFPGALWCIPRHNPHERDRVAAVNAVCESAAGTRRLVVDPTAVPLINDLEQVIYAENGALDKTSNPMLTHASDAFGYWILQDFPIQRTALAYAHQPTVAPVSSAIAASRERRRAAIAAALGDQ